MSSKRIVETHRLVPLKRITEARRGMSSKRIVETHRLVPLQRVVEAHQR